MKVTVSVSGRFHAFYLAEQLFKRDSLSRLITSYPKFEVVKYGIPAHFIESLVFHEAGARIWSKLPLKDHINAQFWFHQQFDKAASRRVPEESDIYVGWSSFSEQGIIRAKRNGTVTIVERGSAHIEYQRDILKEESDRYGGQPQLPHPQIVEKELREYEQADYIGIPSEFVKRTFIDKGFSERKLIKVPYGVDLSQFHEMRRHDNTFRVICAGALSLRKGIHYLLQAFAELRLPEAELWLVGSCLPETEPFLKRYSHNIRLIPHVPQAELASIYSQCSVFCICSIEEGMAMVQPQAMACGLPLICSKNTGGEDLIVDGMEGFVVPIRDVEMLKEKILYLYRHPVECREMGQRAKAKVQQGFTWDDYGATIVEQYKRVLEYKP
jgi:glycosyltransferase involved in cell wall biosynthesis